MEKIAIVSPGYKPVPAVNGGAVETLITYLIESNEKNHIYDIDLYTIYDEKIINSKYQYTNMKFIKENKVFNFILRVINFILKKIKINYVILHFPYLFAKKLNENNYDKIIIENNMVLYKILYKKYKYNKNNFYFHMHNNMNEPGKNISNAKFISKTAKNIIFVSYALKESFTKFTGSNKGVVLHNVIDFSKYDQKLNNKRVQYRNEFKIDNKEYNFIFSGRICSDKGVLELVNSFMKLSKKHKNVSLTIIGFGFGGVTNFYERKILNLIKHNKKIYKYNFMPSKELLKHIISADCVIIPSMYEEAFGVVALEAMAMKKTIIATNAGGLTESLNEECSIIIERDNVENNLYNAMERLYSDRKYAEKIANNAYQKVCSEGEFDIKNYYNNFINILKR